MQSSMCGSGAGRPARASACAASISATVGLTSMIPRWYGWTPSPPIAAAHRQPVDREVDLHARALAAVGLDRGAEPVRQRAVVDQAQEGRLRVGVGEHPLGARSPRRPRARRPTARPSSIRIRSTGASVRISAPASRAASAIASVRRPIPPRTKPHWRMPPPGLLGGVVVQQHERGARGRRPAGRVVDRVPAERRPHLLALEVLGQVLGRRGAEEEERVGDRGRGCAPRAQPRRRELARAHAARGRAAWCRTAAGSASRSRPSSSSNPGSARASAGEKRRISSWVCGEVVVEVQASSRRRTG